MSLFQNLKYGNLTVQHISYTVENSKSLTSHIKDDDAVYGVDIKKTYSNPRCHIFHGCSFSSSEDILCVLLSLYF